MPRLSFQAAVALVLPVALSACGAAPMPRPAALARPAVSLQARHVVPLAEPGALADGLSLDRPFTLVEAGEALADLHLAVPGGDWELPGREAAVLRVLLDGRYNQDVVLTLGEQAHVYQVALGQLGAGPHVIRLERLAAYSPPALGQIQLLGGSVGVLPAGAPGYDVLAHSPIVLTRANPHKTDAPVLMMVEQAPRPQGGVTTKYTTVLTNEDGGTATPALFARWGRTTDIDWCYAIETDAVGAPVRETYQGKLHLTKTFKGRYEDRHPILRISTANNCYDDEGDGGLRLRLAPTFTLTPEQTAREAVLDANPWTYGLMARELFREGKAKREGAGDPRRYVFVEFKQTYRGRGLGVAVTLKGGTQAFVSHHGDSGMTAARSGWCRVAVELPRAVALEDVVAMDLVGPGRGESIVHGVRRVLTLDAAFMPVVWPVSWVGEATVAADGDKVRFYQAPIAPPATP